MHYIEILEDVHYFNTIHFSLSLSLSLSLSCYYRGSVIAFQVVYLLPFLFVFFPGVLHDDLKVFLLNNLSKGKKQKVVLGVADTKLGSAIQEVLGITCQSGKQHWNI